MTWTEQTLTAAIDYAPGGVLKGRARRARAGRLLDGREHNELCWEVAR